jgi:ankyrin repeat protein
LRIAACIVLLLPSAPLLFSSVAAAFKTLREQRQSSGSAYFHGPALELAQAMMRHDTVLVKQLIPAAGDLNQPQEGGVSLWQFGVLQADNREESYDMLRALLAAGADPKRDASADTLESATARGPHLTQFLLEAGANPNVLDDQHRPVWWRNMEPGEDDAATEILRMMLDHGADLSLRAPDGRGPVGEAVANRFWYIACLLVERGADWKQEKLPGGSFPQLLEWEILRREEYPIGVNEKMRKVLADLKGEPLVIPPARAEGDIRIPDLLRETSFDKLEQTRAGLSRLAQRPDWVRRVVAFFEEGDDMQRNHAALLLSLKPEALPEDVQERCWAVLREQVAWYDRSAASNPKERKGWLLKDTAAMAVGLASIPGPARERHRADFTGLRDRIEACRKANDPAASNLADLKKADWMAGESTGIH